MQRVKVTTVPATHCWGFRILSHYYTTYICFPFINTGTDSETHEGILLIL